MVVNMSCSCEGNQCKKRNECANYWANLPPGDYQFIDWSTNGSCSYTDGKIDQWWDCGDLSDGYPLFEKTNNVTFHFNTFIIQAKDINEECKDCRYYAGDGVMVEDIKDALFHISKKQAEIELSYFDEPDEFEIIEFLVHLRTK